MEEGCEERYKEKEKIRKGEKKGIGKRKRRRRGKWRKSVWRGYTQREKEDERFEGEEANNEEEKKRSGGRIMKKSKLKKDYMQRK